MWMNVTMGMTLVIVIHFVQILREVLAVAAIMVSQGMDTIVQVTNGHSI